VNLQTHDYSVFVKPEGLSEQILALNYAFRSEQSNINQFSQAGAIALVGGQRLCNIAITPSAGSNQPPSVNAGNNQTVVNGSTIALSGQVSDDGLPNPPGQVTTLWTKVSGPAANILNDSSLIAMATLNQVGTYQFRLTANDSELSSFDDITINVVPSSTGTSEIKPGNGFNGPTIEPAPVGSGNGVNAKAIARWDVVPYQKIENIFEIGVIAFHMNEIDRVEFAVEGGSWIAVYNMSLNPRTGVVEYRVNLNENDFSIAGSIEIRAIAYPNIGQPRLLNSLFLYVNPADPTPTVRYISPSGSDSSGNGTQASPYRNMWKAAQSIHIANGGNADGGIVYMEEGSYIYQNVGGGFSPNTVNQWLTFQPAPGADRANVKIDTESSSGLDALKLIHLKGVTVKARLRGNNIGNVWYDTAHLEGNGQNGVPYVSWTYSMKSKYLTDSILSDNMAGPENFDMVRNTQILRLGEDVFGHTKLIVNTTVNDIDRGDTGGHPDVYDFWTGELILDNRIVYGLKVTNAQAQGFYFAGPPDLRITNVALVNVLMQIEGFGWKSQVINPVEHLVMRHVSHPQKSFVWRKPQSDLTNISVKGSVFDNMGFADGGSVDPLGFDQNHFIQGSVTPGTNVTTGDPGFTNSAGYDYHLLSNSQLKNRVVPFVPIDLDGQIRNNPASIGAYE
jgi:hypothetical protein